MFEVWAHVPRTQRMGEASVDREVFICKAETEQRAREIVGKLEEKRKEKVAVGSPWVIPDPWVYLPGKAYMPNIYDKYYIRLT